MIALGDKTQSPKLASKRSYRSRLTLLLALTVAAVLLSAVAVMAWHTVRGSGEHAGRFVHAALLSADAALGAESPPEQLQNAGILLRSAAPMDAEQLPAVARRIKTYLRTQLSDARVRVSMNGALPTPLIVIWISSSARPGSWLGIAIEPDRKYLAASALLVLALAAGLVLLAASAMARQLTKPLEQLTLRAPALVAGLTHWQASANQPAEVHALVQALQAAAAQLASVAKERELLLVGISHDLRTPLARLRMALELGDVQDAAQLDALTGDLNEMDQIIGGFLSSARENGLQLPSDVDLNAELSQYVAARRFKWALQVPPNLHTQLPISSFKRAVINVLDNAERHGKAPFALALTSSNGWLNLSITDHGAGIPDSFANDPMRPFKQNGPQRSGNYQSGMGLAIAARLCLRFAGQLEVSSMANPTVVSLRWPLR